MNYTEDKCWNFIKSQNMQRSYNFNVIMPNITREIDTRAVDASCQSVSFGNYSLKDLHRIQFGAERRSYAKDMDIPSISMSFLCSAPDFVSYYFLAWRQLIVDSDGLHGKKVDYSKYVHIQLLQADGSIATQYTCRGVYPIKLPKYNLNYSSEEIVKYTVEFSVDSIEPTYYTITDELEKNEKY